MATPDAPALPLDLLYAYAREDDSLRDRLEDHLAALSKEGTVREWHDREISAGSEWEKRIGEQLEAARIILLLVSASFIRSDCCYGIEMKRALERHESGEAGVIPIILRPCDWLNTPLQRLQALPEDGRPVVDWRPQDRAWLNVVQGIRRAAEELVAGEQPPRYKNPWIEQVLSVLADAQQQREDDRLTGMTDGWLYRQLQVQPGTEEFMGVQDAISQLAAAKLIERWGAHHWRLSTAGWIEATGHVSDAEQDDEFLRGVVDEWRDPTVRRPQANWVSGRAVFARLKWSLSVATLKTIAERLDERGLLERHDAQQEVFVRPTYEALQLFPE